MAKQEKRVNYQTSNSYSTLNTFTKNTQTTWFVCHGIGFLSRYFITYFKGLNEQENYIVAPQAPSKYYQKTDFKHIGASWLTREETQVETQNVMRYFEAVYEEERLLNAKRHIIFGFSQGVSVSMRWMASQQIDCDVLVIYAGGIPKELTTENFAFVTKTQVKVVYGTEDEYFDAARMQKEVSRAEELFGKERVEVIPFKGKHQMKPGVIRELLNIK